MRTYKRTLVTLATVLSGPSRNEGGYTALLISGSTLRPSTILDTLEGADGQQVAILSVDGANHLVDEGGIVVGGLHVSGQVAPCGINGQLHVFATAVNGCIVLVNHIFTLLTV